MRLLMAIMLAATECGGPGGPFQHPSSIDAVMNYKLADGTVCEVETIIDAEMYQAIRAQYAWSPGASEWCPASEIKTANLVVAASFDCTNLPHVPTGCSATACLWQP